MRQERQFVVVQTVLKDVFAGHQMAEGPFKTREEAEEYAARERDVWAELQPGQHGFTVVSLWPTR
jgi:hypothetical protein